MGVAKRVLVADDHELVRKMICALLEDHGFLVFSAANGAEAIAKAQAFNPDLVVLDLDMPVMNGLEAARKLSASQPTLPLLMFTNHASSVLVHEAKAAGISAVVSKTASPELISQVNSLLSV